MDDTTDAGDFYNTMRTDELERLRAAFVADLRHNITTPEGRLFAKGRVLLIDIILARRSATQ